MSALCINTIEDVEYLEFKVVFIQRVIYLLEWCYENFGAEFGAIFENCSKKGDRRI